MNVFQSVHSRETATANSDTTFGKSQRFNAADTLEHSTDRNDCVLGAVDCDRRLKHEISIKLKGVLQRLSSEFAGVSTCADSPSDALIINSGTIDIDSENSGNSHCCKFGKDFHYKKYFRLNLKILPI